MDIHPDIAELIGEIDFDPDALHARYLAERDKRVREDGNAQYVEVKAEFSRYVEDPYVEPGFSRAPVFDEVQFAVIGGGFGGLMMGARLREASFDSIRMVESAARLRWHLVLEPLPWRHVRRGVLLLPAAARRARLYAEAQVFVRA